MVRPVLLLQRGEAVVAVGDLGPQIFTTEPIRELVFDGRHVLRYVLRDGKPWFIAADACAAVGIANVSDAVSRVPADLTALGLTEIGEGRGGTQEVLLVSEAGLSWLILRSDAAAQDGTSASRFTRWVIEDVLPSNQNTGCLEMFVITRLVLLARTAYLNLAGIFRDEKGHAVASRSIR